MDISAAIKRLRAERELTQQDIADAVGVSKVAVGQWESGKSIPRRENLESLSKLFKVSIGELYGEEGPEWASYPVPPGSRRPVGRSGFVPIRVLGKTHAGAATEEIEDEGTVEVPGSVASNHPDAFALRVEGDCMDRRYPDGCVVLVDPTMEPWNGCAVVAEPEPGESVLRRYVRGNSTLMLMADSHSDAYEDMVFSGDEAEVRTVGVVVWFQAWSEETRWDW